VLSCGGRGLATSWSLVQGVLPYVEIDYGIKKIRGGEGPKLDNRSQWRRRRSFIQYFKIIRGPRVSNPCFSCLSLDVPFEQVYLPWSPQMSGQRTSPVSTLNACKTSAYRYRYSSFDNWAYCWLRC
jgi:hypothetical protein